MTRRFSVFVAGAARKELKKLGRSVAAEILSHIDKKLTTRPEEYGEPLHGDLAGYRKLRVSGFRVVYRVVADRVLVLVLAVGKRNEGNVDNIYDRLAGSVLTERMEALIRMLEKKEGEE